MEIGYHDNYSDALWLESHVEDVARQLVKALTEYFGLPFIQPMDPKRGTVRLSYGTLNLRAAPSSAGTVIANLPNGADGLRRVEWMVCGAIRRSGGIRRCGLYRSIGRKADRLRGES